MRTNPPFLRQRKKRRWCPRLGSCVFRCDRVCTAVGLRGPEPNHLKLLKLLQCSVSTSNDRRCFERPYQHPLCSLVLIGKPAPKIHPAIYFVDGDFAESIKRSASDRLGDLVPFVRAGLSRVFHDILLLVICLKILELFSCTPNLPNSSKSIETTVPPHDVVPMYFKCSVH